jgi:hypothetical protein
MTKVIIKMRTQRPRKECEERSKDNLKIDMEHGKEKQVMILRKQQVMTNDKVPELEQD